MEIFNESKAVATYCVNCGRQKKLKTVFFPHNPDGEKKFSIRICEKCINNFPKQLKNWKKESKKFFKYANTEKRCEAEAVEGELDER